MACVKFTNATVHYPISLGGRQASIVSAVASTGSFGRVGRSSKSHGHVAALRNLNLDIRDGERVGLIGRNGSGKSTLLKAISGHLFPYEGTIEVEGDVSAILRLGTGAQMDRSARKNIPNLARLLGLSKEDVPKLEADVEAFCELGEFFDLPMRTYSAGMLVRVMFAAMTYKVNDVLVVDEIIGAGDAYFIEKAQSRALKLYEQANILVMASHSKSIIEGLCNRLIWLEAGQIVEDGDPAEVWRNFVVQREAWAKESRNSQTA